jgi:hypothetical protein
VETTWYTLSYSTMEKKGFDQKVVKFKRSVYLKLYDQNLGMDAGSKLNGKFHKTRCDKIVHTLLG